MVHIISWIYADDVNILGGGINTINKNSLYELLVRRMVNAEKTKYMVVSCEQIAEQNCNIKDRK
jgi:hypothetical protein